MSDTVVVTGGGTAGHIYPALALSEKLKERGFDVVYAGAQGKLEADLAPQAGLEFKSFCVSGFDRPKPWSAITAFLRLKKAEREAREWLGVLKPKAVVGFGGYVSVPVTLEANKLGIASAIHEQNSHMGIANKQLSKHVDRVCLSYTSAGEHVSDKSKIILTGNPVRSSVLKCRREDGLRYLGIEDNSVFVLLIFGGSLGARSINDAICNLKCDILSARDDIFVVHISGKRDYAQVASRLNLSKSEEKRWKLIEYCDEMPSVLACADAIVSRSGATSLAEISALKKPSLLVPFPYATADHQTKNAQEYVNAGGAYMVSDDKVGTDIFKEKLIDLITNEETLREMSKRAESLGSINAADALCDAVLELL